MKNKDKKKNNEGETEVTGTKKVFSFSFRKKKKQETPESTSAPVETKLFSAARVSKKPQIDDHDLSYAGKHLMLLIQHQVDAGLIKVPSKEVSWKALVAINQDVDLVEKKDRAKELCGIRRFGRETQEIAERVSTFVFTHQRHNVIE